VDLKALRSDTRSYPGSRIDHPSAFTEAARQLALSVHNSCENHPKAAAKQDKEFDAIVQFRKEQRAAIVRALKSAPLLSGRDYMLPEGLDFFAASAEGDRFLVQLHHRHPDTLALEFPAFVVDTARNAVWQLTNPGKTLVSDMSHDVVWTGHETGFD